MKIALLTLGTRGDVQPYIALGLGLQESGHTVTLGTSRDFQQMVCGHGLGFYPFEFSVRSVLEDPDSRAAFSSKRAALRLYRRMAPLMAGLLDDAWKAAQGAELILFHPKILNACDIAERLGVPAMLAFYLPACSPTRSFPAPFIPGPVTWGGLVNKISHKLFLRIMTLPYHRQLNRWRVQAVGLAPRRWRGEVEARFGGSVPKIYGYSSHVIPIPPDWDNSAHVTGQWFLKTPVTYQPPDDLQQFLAEGPPPVCFGFGSITGATPERSTAIVLQSLEMAQLRGIVVTGWGGLPAVPNHRDTVRFVDSVPYDWLLPRVSAVVHHGGAGSTAESLRAGKPTLICPLFGDQPFWGQRVFALGVGPRPIHQTRLNAEALAEALRTVTTDAEMRARAEALGNKVSAEDGVRRAVEIVEDHFQNRVS
jgi:sterol 3beta-glucosyltransferase